MHTEHTKLGADGRIVIPAALRAELNFQPGDPLVLESDGDSLLVRSFEAVIRETQDAFAPHRVDGRSVVDELIAERRAEAARELAEEQGDAEPRRG
jgi:AbrB family looped-hinge helix DNA binding protein